MKKAVIFLLACICFMGFNKQSKSQNISFQQKSGIEKEVDSVFHKMINAAENLDYHMLNQGVDDMHKAGFILNDSYFMQFDSLLNSIQARAEGVTGQAILILGQKITVLSEMIALLTAYGDAKVRINSNNSFTTRFYWSFVYEKTNNNWKVIQSHQSGYRY